MAPPMPRLAFALVPVLMFASAIHADDVPIDFEAVETIAAAELKETGVPGAAVAVVRGDRVVFARGFGTTSVEGGVPITPDTIFRLGSTTKMFTAAALVLMSQDGKLKLDAPIGPYVKDLPAHFAPLTLHQLLTHTAGVTDETHMNGALDEASLGREIRTWKADFLFAPPGKVFSYSNPGYRIAGLVAEEIDGKPYADVVEARLFRPLGMKRSTFRPLMAVTYPFSQGHQRGTDGMTVIRPMAENASGYPPGSLFSNTSDLSRWAIAFLNDGKLDGKEVLPPAVIAAMSTKHVATPSGRHYGYGLNVEVFRGVPVVEHGGSRAGYGSFIRFLPTQKAAIIVLCNTTGGQLPRTLEAITQKLAPLAPPPARPVTQALTEAEVKQFAGRFTNNRGRMGLIEINGTLSLRRVPGKELPVTKLGPNHLRTTAGELYVVPDPTGKAEFLFMGGRTMRRIP